MNLLWFKRPQRLFLIPGIVTAAIFGAWQLFTLVYLGPATIGENLASLREFTAGAAAVFSQELMLRSLSELFSAKSFLWLLFPVLGYSLYWLARPHGVMAEAQLLQACGFFSCQDRRHQLAILYALVIINLLWYVVASVSWLRYAFVGLAFATFFVALTFANLTANFERCPALAGDQSRRPTLAWLCRTGAAALTGGDHRGAGRTAGRAHRHGPARRFGADGAGDERHRAARCAGRNVGAANGLPDRSPLPLSAAVAAQPHRAPEVAGRDGGRRFLRFHGA